MASPIAWGLGFAGSGIDTATVSPVYTSAKTIWLNSNGGNDANAGTEPELPVATIAQAVTNSVANSVIVVAAGHTQTIVGTQAFGSVAGLRVVGCGTGSNRPKFTPTSGATAMFNVTSADVVFENIYFGAAAGTSGSAGRLTTNQSGTQVLNCQIDCGAFDQEGFIWSSCANGVVNNCNFTAVASRPTRALLHNTGACNNFQMNGVVFDGSTFGWAGIACVPAAATDLVIKNLTLAGNSDLVAAITSYQIFGVTTSGAGRVTIT